MAVLSYGKFKRSATKGSKNKSNIVRNILPETQLVHSGDFIHGETVNWFRYLRGGKSTKIPAIFLRYGATSKNVCYIEYTDPKTKETRQTRAATEQVERPRT